MYIKEPTYKGSWSTYFEVFDNLVWGSMFIMALIVSCLGSILFVNKEGNSKYIYNFGSAFAFFLGTFSVGAISQGVAKTIICTCQIILVISNDWADPTCKGQAML